MAKKKGFLHVIEVVIVVVLIFVVMSQFTSIPMSESTWSSTKLSMMAQDLAYTLQEKGIDWFDKSDLDSNIYSVLPSTMGYTVHTRQQIPPVMRIGCYCNLQNYTYLQNSLARDLSGFNGVDRDFITERIVPGNIADRCRGAEPERVPGHGQRRGAVLRTLREQGE
jgi:hypothetical protein